jgi:nitrite reductase/ring-hydroxylating ferredoxin subunit
MDQPLTITEDGFYFLISVADLENNASQNSGQPIGKEFIIDNNSIFAIYRRHTLRAYLNRCPHLGLPLNWLPDKFLDADGELIQCSSHGALFTIDQGLCVAGPCVDQSLLPLETRIENANYLVRLPPPSD